MLRQLAFLFVAGLITSCATAVVQSVSVRDDPRYYSAETDVARIGWYSHSRDMAGVRVVLQLEAGEVISRESVWVRETDAAITLCYSVDRSDSAADKRKVVLYVRASGIPRGDLRLVDASRACGKTA